MRQHNTNPHISQARFFCRQLVKKEARNFYYGFLLLPRRKREAVYSLYAFCRILDDAVDDMTQGNSDAEALMARFNAIIDMKNPISEQDELISTALRETMMHFPLSRRQLNWIIKGVFMDLDVSRYSTMGELRKYLFGVASAVGLACIEIFRYRGPHARKYAIYLGYAMQLTNIIRDVKEDYLRGRIYLPEEDLKRFHVQEEELGGSHTSEALQELLAFEARRALDFFAKSGKLWPLLARDAAPCPYALSLIYRKLLLTMEKNGFHVLEKRFGLPVGQKLFLMARAKSAFLL